MRSRAAVRRVTLRALQKELLQRRHKWPAMHRGAQTARRMVSTRRSTSSREHSCHSSHPFPRSPLPQTHWCAFRFDRKRPAPRNTLQTTLSVAWRGSAKKSLLSGCASLNVLARNALIPSVLQPHSNRRSSTYTTASSQTTRAPPTRWRCSFPLLWKRTHRRRWRTRRLPWRVPRAVLTPTLPHNESNPSLDSIRGVYGMPFPLTD